jgi:hypothetical protein
MSVINPWDPGNGAGYAQTNPNGRPVAPAPSGPSAAAPPDRSDPYTGETTKWSPLNYGGSHAARAAFIGDVKAAGERRENTAYNAFNNANDLSGGFRREGAIGFANSLGARGQTEDALARLRNYYQQGPGPSAAEAQLAQGQNAAMAQAIALAHSGRGSGGNAVAMRNAAFQNAATNQQTNAQAATLRAQEGQAWRQQQLGAMGLEQNALGNLRGEDISTMAGANQTGLGYGQLGQGYLQLGDQAGLQGESLMNDIYGKQLSADTARFGAEKGYDASTYNQAPWWLAPTLTVAGGIAGGIAGGPAGAAGGAAGGSAVANGISSDVRAKKNIQPTDAMSLLRQLTGGQSGVPMNSPSASGYGANGAADFTMQPYNTDTFNVSDVRAKKNIMPAEAAGTLRAVFGGPAQAPTYDLRPAQAYSYDYKNPHQPGAAPGRQVGPMAQDLEKTPAGASTVFNGPRGKGVDTSRLALVNAAATAEQQRKQDEQDQHIANLYRLLDAGAARGAADVGSRFGGRY